MSKYKTDEHRLESLIQGKERAWQTIYDDIREPFRLFFLKNSNLDPEQAIELYQEAMVVFHKNVTRGKLVAPLQSALKTYLIGIGKMLYLKKSGKKIDAWIDEIPDQAIMPVVEDQAERKDQKELVRRLLDRIGEPCKQLLTLVYIKGYVMEAVADEMNFPSQGAVRKRKFDCLKKMREMI